MKVGNDVITTGKRQFVSPIGKIKRYWFFYMLVLPGFVHVLIFSYIPMYGIIVALKDYNYRLKTLLSPWAQPLFKHFTNVFLDPGLYKVLVNTVLINLYNIAFGTAFVIFLALMLNEIKITIVKRISQTFVYLPHFLSWVIFAGIVTTFLSPSEGPVNQLISSLGREPVYFLMKPNLFRSILVGSNIIKSAGFGTIIYLAAISGINLELYESATIDGAHRGHMIWHITLPRIKPTIAVLLILSAANLFNSNFEQVFNLYNPAVYETGDVLSTYMYRLGLVSGNYEGSTALGLVFNVIGLTIIVLTNKVANKMDVTGIF